MKLHAEFIPQTEMFKHHWFKPKNHKEWYYHTPLLKPPKTKKKDEEIIKTIDKPLRDLFIYLTLNGYETLPSCSGHFLKEEDYRKKYSLLIKDIKDIKNNGLIVKDTESEKMYRYTNPNYNSPYDSYQEFKDQIEKNAVIGYIGIVQPPKIIDLEYGPVKISTDNKYFGIPVAHIKINNLKENDIKTNWDNTLEIIIQAFNS